jgi:hypothetical protein
MRLDKSLKLYIKLSCDFTKKNQIHETILW